MAPLRRAISAMYSPTSPTGDPSSISWNTPWPASPTASPIAMSSSIGARVPGISPCFERCNIVRDVEKPTAPASSACWVSRAISAISSSVASSCARSPIT